MSSGFGVVTAPKATDYQGINASVDGFAPIKNGKYNGKKVNTPSRVWRFFFGETGSSVVDNDCRFGRSSKTCKATSPNSTARTSVQHGKGGGGIVWKQRSATVSERKTTKKTVESRLDQSKTSQNKTSILGRRVKWVGGVISYLKKAESYLRIGFYNFLLKLSEDESERGELKKCIKEERKNISKINGKEALGDCVDNLKKGDFKAASKNGFDAMKSALKVVST